MSPHRTARHVVVVAGALAGMWLVAAAAAQQVGRTVAPRGIINEDIYLAGGTIDLRADVRGDVVAAGGQISIEQRVEQDVIAAGGVVDLAAEILDDVRAAGGVVTMRGRIGGDAVAAGGTVVLGPDASVGGRSWFGGGNVEVAGHVDKDLKAAGGKILISGTIDGDVELAGDEIDILSTARVAGSLVYRSPRQARIDPGAEIRGGVTHVPVEGPSTASRVFGKLFLVLAAGLLGGLLVLALPRFSVAAVEAAGRRPWQSLGLGAAVFVGGPVLGVVLLVTVVGWAVALALFAVYGLALAAGFLTGALWLGALGLRATGLDAPDSPGAWIGALAAGLVLVALLGLVPVLGGLAALAVMLLGLGAVVSEAWHTRRGRGEAAAAT